MKCLVLSLYFNSNLNSKSDKLFNPFRSLYIPSVCNIKIYYMAKILIARSDWFLSGLDFPYRPHSLPIRSYDSTYQGILTMSCIIARSLS